MAAPSTTKINEYKVLIQTLLESSLTPTQLATAKSTAGVLMLEAETADAGDTSKIDTYKTWLTTKPLAMQFFTTAGTDAYNNFHTTIYSTPATTAADALPSTYIALHAETKSNEAKIAGVLALRALGVDSTYGTTGANLGAVGGTALSDAYVMGRYAAWGADKFTAIFSKGAIASIMNESDANYDTLAEVIAVYDAWSSATQVSAREFFAGLDKLYDGGVTGIKFSELYADYNNLANFRSHTADNTIKLMASTGGSWATVTGLGAAKYAALTTDNAAKAIASCGATYTAMDTVYTADTTKSGSLLSNDAVSLCSKGYSGITYAGLSTGYGTTYTTAKDVEFRQIVDPKYQDLFAAGVTYAHMAAAQQSGELACVHANSEVNKMIIGSNAPDTVFSALVGITSTDDFSGLQAIGTLCS